MSTLSLRVPTRNINRPSRVFGQGIEAPALNLAAAAPTPAQPRRRGPSGADLAYEVGRTAYIEMERDSNPPAGYDAVERDAFGEGQEAGKAELDARADAMAESYREEQEWAAYSERNGVRFDDAARCYA